MSGLATTPQRLGHADPLEMPRTIRRHWRLVAIFALGMPALTAAALSRIPPTYTATGTLLYAPRDFNPKLLRGVLEASQVTDALMASQVTVIRGLPVVEAVASRLRRAAGRKDKPARPSLWLRWLGLKALPAKPLSHAERLRRVRAALSVVAPAGSQVLEVSFANHDPNLAALGANAAMQAYLDRQREAGLAVLDHAQAWLAGRAKATARRVEALDVAIVRARAASGTERGEGDAPLTNQAAGRLTDSLVAAEADLAAAGARVRAEADGSASAAEAAVAPDIAPMRAREAELAARLGREASTEGPNYPGLRAARHQLAALRGQIAAETGRLVAADRARRQADEARVAALKSALAAARGKAAAESVRAAPLASLTEQRDADRALLRAQTEQIGTLESQNALMRPDARIVSPATPPARPSAPRGAMIVGGAALLGLCAGILAAIAAEALNAQFRSGGEVLEALDLPCVALIPEVGRRARRGLSVPDYARSHPFSPFSEQVRALRAGLWLDPAAPRSLAITAARPDEGKTTLAIALASALAGSGMRVLAIDCDIRQPGFDAAFDLGGLPGLTDHLAGRATLEAAIHRRDGSGPDVMPAGAVATDALSLFMSGRLPRMMAALRERYDLVILDLPPVFALAEAPVLARAAEATLLCIRWNRTPRRVVTAARTMLDRAGIRLAGTVLTRVDGARHARAGYVDSELYHPRYGGYFRP